MSDHSADHEKYESRAMRSLSINKNSSQSIEGANDEPLMAQWQEENKEEQQAVPHAAKCSCHLQNSIQEVDAALSKDDDAKDDSKRYIVTY